MSTTLSYGFIKPATGDLGSVFFPALETDIQSLNDHTHNGTNSARLTAASSLVVTQTISAASWGATIGGGLYRQLITIPAALSSYAGTYDNHSVQFRNAANGRILMLTPEKVSTTTYYIYVNDNTLDLTAVWS